MYRRSRRQLARAAALRKLSPSRCALAETAELLKRAVSGGGKGVALELLLSSKFIAAACVRKVTKQTPRRNSITHNFMILFVHKQPHLTDF